MEQTPGLLALVGGGEWQGGCSFDADFLAPAGTHEGLVLTTAAPSRHPAGFGVRARTDAVLVLPTAAAYEHPERLVVRAGEWFDPLGGRVEGLMVVSRADAED